MTRLRTLLLIVDVLLLGCGAWAQVPQLVNYQGRVAVGAVNFEGAGQFKFALVSPNGSATYWSNDGTSAAGSQPAAAVALTVTKGLYSVLLGDGTLANMAAIPASVWSNPDVRLRVWFNDGVNGFQKFTPDQRLAPNGYLPEGAVTPASLANGAIDLTGSKVTGALPIGRGGTGASTAAAVLAKLGAANPPQIFTSMATLYTTAPSAAGQIASVVENGVMTQYVAAGTGLGAWRANTGTLAHLSVSPKYAEAYAGAPVPLETVLGQSGIVLPGTPKADGNFQTQINAAQWAGKTVVASVLVVATGAPSGTGPGPWTLAVRMGVAYTTPPLDGTTPTLAPNVGYASGSVGETGVVAHPAPAVANAPMWIKTAPFTVPANITSAGLAFGFWRTDSAKDTSTNTILILEARLDELWPAATQPAWVSATGDDNNSGLDSAHPKSTLAAASAAIGGIGPIVMQPGTYTGASLNITGTTGLRIIGQGVVKVMLGEKVSTFTNHSGNIWKASISTVIPADSASTNFVFEWGTPEGAITVPMPLEQGRAFRLDHYRLRRGTSKDTLTAGQWFYAAGVLYICRTDGSNPNGHDYWIPHRSGSTPGPASFIFGGSNSEAITVENVQVYFGENAFELNSVANYTVRRCLAFGSSRVGIWTSGGTTIGLEEDCEYAASCADGGGQSFSYPGASLSLTVINAWAHDNGDQGHSAHGAGARVNYVVGLFENNLDGGILWVQDSYDSGSDVMTRNNLVCGLGAGIRSVTGTGGAFTRWTSVNDQFGAYQQGQGTLFIGPGCSITNPTVNAYHTFAAGDIIDVAPGVGPATSVMGGPPGTVIFH